jgi:hypothetical protein
MMKITDLTQMCKGTWIGRWWWGEARVKGESQNKGKVCGRHRTLVRGIYIYTF